MVINYRCNRNTKRFLNEIHVISNQFYLQTVRFCFTNYYIIIGRVHNLSRGGTIIYNDSKGVGGSEILTESKTRYKGGGGYQKVSVCTSLDESVHNVSLYCCVYFFGNSF